MSLEKVFNLWHTLSKTSLGKSFFSFLISFVNPYTGSLGARVEVFEKGHAEVTLKDYKKNRNHLNSIHAIALTNLGEFTSGLAVLSSLRPNVRGIVTHIDIEFLKKARGKLNAISKCTLNDIKEDTSFRAKADIYDANNDKVACVNVTWQLGLRERHRR